MDKNQDTEVQLFLITIRRSESVSRGIKLVRNAFQIPVFCSPEPLSEQSATFSIFK